MSKSCFNCRWLLRYSYPETLEDPADNGWDCSHEDLNSFPDVEGICDSDSDEKRAILYAENCPGYEFFNWEEQERKIAEYENEFTPLPEQEQELCQLRDEYAMQTLIDAGLITADGQPTDEYYSQSDFAYNCSRESRKF